MWSKLPRILVVVAASLAFAACGGGDNKHYPAPVATGMSPASATVTGPAFTLTVTGTGFVSKSVVQWEGTARPTVYVSSTELQAAIAATDIAEGGARSVTVYNPPPGGGTSSSLTFTIDVPPPVVQLNSSATEVPAGESVTLTWTSRYAKACVATGSWAGAKATSGTERSGPLSTASRFALECQGSGGTRSAEVLVIIALPKYSWISLPFERAVALNDRGDATGNIYRKEAGVWFPRIAVAYINGDAISFNFGNTTPPVYQSTAGDINARQEVLVATNLPYCFIYRAGDLVPMAGIPCAAINDRSHMAGSVMVDQGGQSASQAALYVDGVVVLVDMPPGTVGYGVDLNESDQMAGNLWAIGNYSTAHPFLYSGGRMTDLGTLGGEPSYASAINESGVVVGESTLANGHIHAFRYDASGMVDLGTLGGDYSTAYGINDSGAVVGKSQRAGADGCCSAFLFDHGHMYDLNEHLAPALAHRLDEAVDINNLGQIVASACWAEETSTLPPISVRICRAYLLTPIPGSSAR